MTEFRNFMSSEVSKENSIQEELQKMHETMKDMNSKLENISDQNRPWISMTDNEKKYKLENNLLTLYLKNFGSGPAINMKLKGLTSSKEDIDEEAISKRPSTEPFSIAPGEPFSYGIEASQDKILAAAEGNSLYFGIEDSIDKKPNEASKEFNSGSVPGKIISDGGNDIRIIDGGDGSVIIEVGNNSSNPATVEILGIELELEPGTIVEADFG